MNGVLHGCMIKRSQRVTVGDKGLTDCGSPLAKSSSTRNWIPELASLFLDTPLNLWAKSPTRSIVLTGGSVAVVPQERRWPASCPFRVWLQSAT